MPDRPGGRTVEHLVELGKILLVNIVLSGDNAILIGMAGKNLPKEQQAKTIWWGAAGAVLLRLALIGAAVLLLRIPLLQTAGALFLLYIAVKMLVHDEAAGGAERGGPGPRGGAGKTVTFAAAVRTVIAADFVMSLDNVLAIAAIAAGDWLLIVIGVLSSIPVIVWGSAAVMRLLQRFPALMYVGSGVLGYTAGEMLVGDHAAARWLAAAPPALEWALPPAAAAAVIAAGWWMRRRKSA